MFTAFNSVSNIFIFFSYSHIVLRVFFLNKVKNFNFKILQQNTFIPEMKPCHTLQVSGSRAGWYSATFDGAAVIIISICTSRLYLNLHQTKLIASRVESVLPADSSVYLFTRLKPLVNPFETFEFYTYF